MSHLTSASRLGSGASGARGSYDAGAGARASSPARTPSVSTSAPGPPGAYASGGTGTGTGTGMQGDYWELEPVTVSGVGYLVDRASGAVYRDAQGGSEWPQCVGSIDSAGVIQIYSKRSAGGWAHWWRGAGWGAPCHAAHAPQRMSVLALGSLPERRRRSPWPQAGLPARHGLMLVLHLHAGNLFGALDTFLKTNKVRFTDLFSHFDSDKSGSLEVRAAHGRTSSTPPQLLLPCARFVLDPTHSAAAAAAAATIASTKTPAAAPLPHRRMRSRSS